MSDPWGRLYGRERAGHIRSRVAQARARAGMAPRARAGGARARRRRDTGGRGGRRAHGRGGGRIRLAAVHARPARSRRRCGSDVRARPLAAFAAGCRSGVRAGGPSAPRTSGKARCRRRPARPAPRAVAHHPGAATRGSATRRGPRSRPRRVRGRAPAGRPRRPRRRLPARAGSGVPAARSSRAAPRSAPAVHAGGAARRPPAGAGVGRCPIRRRSAHRARPRGRRPPARGTRHHVARPRATAPVRRRNGRDGAPGRRRASPLRAR